MDDVDKTRREEDQRAVSGLGWSLGEDSALDPKPGGGRLSGPAADAGASPGAATQREGRQAHDALCCR